MKLVGGAIPSVFGGAVPYLPAELASLQTAAFQRNKQEDLAFDMRGNLAPPLLETLDRFRRYTQDLSELTLRFSQILPDTPEFLPFHGKLPSNPSAAEFPTTHVVACASKFYSKMR